MYKVKLELELTNDELQLLTGIHQQNLNYCEELFHVNLFYRGSSLD